MTHTTRRLTLAVTACFALSFLVLSSVFLARWWAHGARAPPPPSASLEDAHTFRVLVQPNASSIVTETLGTFRYWARLSLASDPNGTIGRMQGAMAITASGFAPPAHPFTMLCEHAYAFTGAGGVAAGELVAMGTFASLDATTFDARPLAITGGTPTYATAMGEIQNAGPWSLLTPYLIDVVRL